VCGPRAREGTAPRRGQARARPHVTGVQGTTSCPVRATGRTLRPPLLDGRPRRTPGVHTRFDRGPAPATCARCGLSAATMLHDRRWSSPERERRDSREGGVDLGAPRPAHSQPRVSARGSTWPPRRRLAEWELQWRKAAAWRDGIADGAAHGYRVVARRGGTRYSREITSVVVGWVGSRIIGQRSRAHGHMRAEAVCPSPLNYIVCGRPAWLADAAVTDWLRGGMCNTNGIPPSQHGGGGGADGTPRTPVCAALEWADLHHPLLRHEHTQRRPPPSSLTAWALRCAPPGASPYAVDPCTPARARAIHLRTRW